MYNMAKTIMISNEVYNELKMLKKDKSFSETLKGLMGSDSKKTGAGLKSCLGILKKDKEWEEVEKIIKRGWGDWSKKYV